MSEKHCELAVFAVQVNDGRTWAEAMAEWNRRTKKKPGWSYRQVGPFNRDARVAVERITGGKLAWQRSRGEVKHRRGGRRRKES